MENTSTKVTAIIQCKRFFFYIPCLTDTTLISLCRRKSSQARGFQSFRGNLGMVWYSRV